VLTTGMIEPFHPKDLGRVTYTCNFSGRYKYWDNGILEEKELSEHDELILRPNSIAFLETEQTFRIPHYFVLRFNLRVQHVHKGLLLGTGPVVDPGFIGRLYIPLHNLTSNEYLIKKHAKLISVEFTKLNRYGNSKSLLESSSLASLVKFIDFSLIPDVCRIFKHRGLDEYIKNALVGDDFFRKKSSNVESDILSIGSSIPNAIKQSQDNAKESKESAQKTVKQFEEMKRIYTMAGIAALIAVLLSAATVIISVQNIINDLNSRIDNVLIEQPGFINSFHGMKKEIRNVKEKTRLLNATIINLQAEIMNLQHGSGENP